MGNKAVEKKRKKKKGRPSLLDLQKRSLKQQQEQQPPPSAPPHQLKSKNHKIQNPNPDYSAGVRRSTRRNPNPNPKPSPDPTTDDEERSASKRREKKLKLVLKLPDEDGELTSGSDSNPDEDHSSGSNPRKRKIGSIAHGSSRDSDDKGEKHGASANQTRHKLDNGPSTPLPDQKLLLFILDRLQKKDTYGVFAEPVDPEELPDYHEVIANPMDFSTVRKKLASGSYANLEQFEKDVFLICSNAMRYNSPDTIYFRQARSMQELAKKNFENLRQDSDDNENEPEPEREPEPKVVRRGRPPTKNLKRPPGRPPLERTNSDFSEATPPKTGVNNNRKNIDTRKGTPLLEKCGPANLFTQSFFGSRYAETCIGWSAERHENTDEMTGSASKGVLMKHGKKQIVLDENRRNTYRQTYALACRQEPSVLTTFNGERKQLLAVGLHTEYGYARSLARFAAKLGPAAWKVASKKIQRCLPAGVNFGPGWVGENEAPTERSTPHQFPESKSSSPVHWDPSSTSTQRMVETNGDKSAQSLQGEQLSEMHKSLIPPKSDDGSSKAPSPSSAGNETTQVSSSLVIPSNGAGPSSNAAEASTSSNPNPIFNMSSSSPGAMRAAHRFPNFQSSNIQSHINGLNGSYGRTLGVQMGKIIGAAKSSEVNHQSSPSVGTVSRADSQSLHPPSAINNGSAEAKLLENSSTVKPSHVPGTGRHEKLGPTQPDLNVGPGSPNSGRADSVQPDLALQL